MLSAFLNEIHRAKGFSMKKLILCFAFLSLMVGHAWAATIIGTSNPPASPLLMSAGTTSGPMSVNVVSNNPPNDVMAAWNFQIEIIPNAGATGTLTFQTPATGTPANPPSYIFGPNGLGISATNSVNILNANDFYNPGVGAGVPVPGLPGANLLQETFHASSNASGLFGIYADEGTALTQWTDSNFVTQFFTNVPSGTGRVLIGDVLIPSLAVPEPSSLVLFGLSGGALIGWQLWRMGWPRWRRLRCGF